MADSKLLPLNPDTDRELVSARTPSRVQSGPVRDSIVQVMLTAGGPSAGSEWSPPSPEELQEGLPQYEVLSLIARGGMGAVYKGRHLRLDRLVAIKILPPGGNNHALNFAERFKQEARAMAQFSHPCIVPVYDAGETWGGLLYFVMEFVEGSNVEQIIIERGKLPQIEAAKIAASVCEALAYAHRHRVVHRDIKPSNVILNALGQVKVADFGLAKLPPAASTTATSADVNIGTVGFMAPEAFTPGAQVDHRADIYAVGAMLYQMLTGRIPQGVFDMPSRLVPGLDERFDRIVGRAMKADRDARHATAEELLAEIAPMLPGAGLAPRRRNRAVWNVLMVAAVLVFGGIAWSGFARRDRGNISGPTPGMWVNAFPDVEKIDGVAIWESGWVRCRPDAAGLLASSGGNGVLALRNGGVRVRFRAHEAGKPWAKLELLKRAPAPVPAFRYIPPGAPGQMPELRIELTIGRGMQFVTVGTARADASLEKDEEYVMEFYAIGRLLIGRLNQQTLVARLGDSGVPAEGPLGIWGADRNFFHDFEVINLDGFAEAEALKILGIRAK